MNFFDAIKTCYKKYGNFSGRASRSEYWYFYLFLTLVNIPVTILFETANIQIESMDLILTLVLVFNIASLVPIIAVTARRLHDVNLSGWWQLIVITIIGMIPYYYFLIKKGDEGDNRFGSNPIKN